MTRQTFLRPGASEGPNPSHGPGGAQGPRGARWEPRPPNSGPEFLCVLGWPWVCPGGALAAVARAHLLMLWGLHVPPPLPRTRVGLHGCLDRAQARREVGQALSPRHRTGASRHLAGMTGLKNHLLVQSPPEILTQGISLGGPARDRQVCPRAPREARPCERRVRECVCLRYRRASAQPLRSTTVSGRPREVLCVCRLRDILEKLRVRVIKGVNLFESHIWILKIHKPFVSSSA